MTMTELLKMEIGWGTLKASDIVGYVPIVISEADYKEITGQDYKKEGAAQAALFLCIRKKANYATTFYDNQYD